MGHPDIGPLEAGPNIGRTGNDDPVPVDDLIDGPGLEGGLGLFGSAIQKLHALMAVGPLPNDHGLLVIDPYHGLMPRWSVHNQSSYGHHSTSIWN